MKPADKELFFAVIYAVMKNNKIREIFEKAERKGHISMEELQAVLPKNGLGTEIFTLILHQTDVLHIPIYTSNKKTKELRIYNEIKRRHEQGKSLNPKDNNALYLAARDIGLTYEQAIKNTLGIGYKELGIRRRKGGYKKKCENWDREKIGEEIKKLWSQGKSLDPRKNNALYLAARKHFKGGYDEVVKETLGFDHREAERKYRKKQYEEEMELIAFMDSKLKSNMWEVLANGEKKGSIALEEIIDALPCDGDPTVRWDIFEFLLRRAEALHIPVQQLPPPKRRGRKADSGYFQAQKWVQELTEEKINELENQIFDLLDEKKEN